MAYNKRINDEDLPGNYVDGSVLLHTDMNKLETLTREGINANYEDIQKLQDGTTVIGYAATAGSAETSSALDSATLSTYSEETLQNNDAKVPTSKQVKEYVDDAVSGLTTDYSDLTNKPSINGVTLDGNKTSADLGIFDDVPLYYFDGANNASNVAMLNEICTRYDNGEEIHLVGKFADGELNQVFQAPINITKYSTGDDNWASFISDPIPWLDHSYTPYAKVRYCAYALQLTGTWGNYTAVSEYRLDDFVPLTAETDPVFSASVAAGITSNDITKWNNAEENVQSDWSQSDNTKDDFIKNKPNIPTVNDAILTIQKNGTTIDTFTANASTDKTINISVPTKTSDLTNDGDRDGLDREYILHTKHSELYQGNMIFDNEVYVADDNHLGYMLEDTSLPYPFVNLLKIANTIELTAQDTIPTATSYYLGKVYQYTGATNANYTHGYFYQCVSDGAASPTYSWERIDVQPSGGGGTVTDVQVDGTSILSSGVANLVTNTAYNASTNKIATMSDLPTKTSDLTNDGDGTKPFLYCGSNEIDTISVYGGGSAYYKNLSYVYHGVYGNETKLVANYDDVPKAPNVVILTEAEYNDLTEYADNTEYHIIES